MEIIFKRQYQSTGQKKARPDFEHQKKNIQGCVWFPSTSQTPAINVL